MRLKKSYILTNLIISSILILTLCSCSTKNIKLINNKTYSFQKDQIILMNNDSDNLTIYGVMSDTHGETEKARYFANLMKEKGAEGIIIAGDIPLNEELRYGTKDTHNDKNEIVNVLSAVADTGLPILIIPGNHESKDDYYEAMNELSYKYNNIIDMTKYRVLKTDDVNFVSIPGYTDQKFITKNGFWASPDIIIGTDKFVENFKGPVVLITHGPPKTAVPGPGTIYNKENKLKDAGSNELRDFQVKYNITLIVSGHIHESGGLAANINGTLIPENKLASHYTVNFGTLENWTYLDNITRSGRAGIIIIKSNKTKYQILEIK